jgi:multifunctional beta-oxidation protein
MLLVSDGRGLSELHSPTTLILHLSRSSPSGKRSLPSVSPLPFSRPSADSIDERATNPSSGAEAAQQMIANFENVSGGSGSSDNESYDDAEDTPEIKAAKAKQLDPDDFTYTERDVMLYNLGVGAKADELHLTYENAEGFAVRSTPPRPCFKLTSQPLPTFGVIPQFGSSSGLPFDSFVPNFSPMKLLHGEQYLKLNKGRFPTSATVQNSVKLVEVLDKGKTAAVTFKVITKDKSSGEQLCENQSTIILRGSGGFGGKKTGSGMSSSFSEQVLANDLDRGPATAQNNPPSRKPDAVIEEKTTLEQAALYRLSGDYNPLHIDPQFSSVGGFPAPSKLSIPDLEGHELTISPSRSLFHGYCR